MTGWYNSNTGKKGVSPGTPFPYTIKQLGGNKTYRPTGHRHPAIADKSARQLRDADEIIEQNEQISTGQGGVSVLL